MPDQLTCSPGGYNTPSNPFNGPLSRTTWVSQYYKIFTHLLPIFVGSISSISSIDYSPQNPLSTTSNHVFFGLLLYLTPLLCNLCSFHWLHTQQQPFYDPLSGTTRVSRYQKKHSPTHHPDHPIFISFFHLPQSIASSLFKLRAWQSFCTTSLLLGLEPPASYSIHFFTQSVSSFQWLP